MNQRIVSSRFPYLPLSIEVPGTGSLFVEVEAFLDTGFDGDVVIPWDFVASDKVPDGYLPWRLADGSEIITPVYVSTVELGRMGTFPVVIAALGDEPMIGRGVIDRFSIVLDHGQRVIVDM